MIFIDTGMLYSAFVWSDPKHTWAFSILQNRRLVKITSDYVVDEVLTLLRSRGRNQWAIEAGRYLLRSGLIRIEHLSWADIQAAWTVLEQFSDKAWSFTDCTSYVVMRRLGITEAAAFDEHFRQFGFVTVRP